MYIFSNVLSNANIIKIWSIISNKIFKELEKKDRTINLPLKLRGKYFPGNERS